MKRLAIVRGKFLNAYEMQSFAPLVGQYDITAFGSLTPYHDAFPFTVIKLPSPMDIPDFPYKMPVLNRLFVDAHYLVGLEDILRGFDIVHSAETYYHYTQQALNAKKKGYVKKVIATVLENIPYNNEGIWGRKRFKERARNELDHMIALTKLAREALIQEGADSHKITVIHHGIDTSVFRPTGDHLKHLSDPDKKEIHILFAGRLESYKGVMDILDAAEILLQDTAIKQHLVFIFVGGGSLWSAMIKKERELGIEKFVVHTQIDYAQIPHAYKDADIFVAPSKTTKTWREQYCTVLLEAQSMGLPIVTTGSGGIPENLGDAGLYIDEGDSLALAKALKQYIIHPELRVKYGLLARARALTVHDTRIIAKKLSALYQHVLSS